MTEAPAETLRLSKRVIALTGCSRAQAERYIEGGQVRVDGEIVDRPEFPVSGQQVSLDLDVPAAPTLLMTLLLHKPAAAVTLDGASLIRAETRWDDDPSDLRNLRRHLARLSPLLPLEDSASGLQAYTQDGRLLQRMREEGSRIEQEFIVEVKGSIASYGLHRLGHGVEFEGRVLPPCKVSWQNETRLRFAIKGVRPGQLASMCQQVGLVVQSIKRIRIGRIPLAKQPEGQWRYLPIGEKF